MKHIANTLTLLRIPLSVAMLCAAPFSTGFWVFYLCAGLTDLLDGPVARKLGQESPLGAKLDSIADLVFAGALAFFVAVHLPIPRWLWLCILGIALLRFASYGIGFYKYHTWVSLHTYANKLTGAFLFLAPVFYRVCGWFVTGVVLCAVAFASALEELVITLKSPQPDRDRKGLWLR